MNKYDIFKHFMGSTTTIELENNSSSRSKASKMRERFPAPEEQESFIIDWLILFILNLLVFNWVR